MRNVQIKSATLAMWAALTLGVTNTADSIVQGKPPGQEHGQNFNPRTRPLPLVMTSSQLVQVIQVGHDVRIAVHGQGRVETHVYHRDTEKLELHPSPPEEYPRLSQGSWAELSRAYQDRINREELSLLRLADGVRRDKKLSPVEKKKIFKRIEEHAAVSRRHAATEWEIELGANLYHPGNALPVREVFVSRDEANSMLSHGLVAVNTAFRGARETLGMGVAHKTSRQAAEEALNLVSRAGVDCDRIMGVRHLIDDRGQREQIEEVIRRCDEAVRELRKFTDDQSEEPVDYRHAIDRVRTACDTIDRVHLKKDVVKKGGKCSFHPIYPFYPKQHKHHKINPPGDGGNTSGGSGSTSAGGGSTSAGNVSSGGLSQTAQSTGLIQSESADILAQDAERQRIGASLAPLCFVDDNETDDSEVGNRRISTQCCQTSDLDSEGKPVATQCCPTDKLDENGQPVLKPCSEEAKVTELKPA